MKYILISILLSYFTNAFAEANPLICGDNAIIIKENPIAKNQRIYSDYNLQAIIYDQKAVEHFKLIFFNQGVLGDGGYGRTAFMVTEKNSIIINFFEIEENQNTISTYGKWATAKLSSNQSNLQILFKSAQRQANWNFENCR